jgi:hypothetical protein
MFLFHVQKIFQSAKKSLTSEKLQWFYKNVRVCSTKSCNQQRMKEKGCKCTYIFAKICFSNLIFQFSTCTLQFWSTFVPRIYNWTECKEKFDKWKVAKTLQEISGSVPRKFVNCEVQINWMQSMWYLCKDKFHFSSYVKWCLIFSRFLKLT